MTPPMGAPVRTGGGGGAAAEAKVVKEEEEVEERRKRQERKRKEATAAARGSDGSGDGVIFLMSWMGEGERKGWMGWWRVVVSLGKEERGREKEREKREREKEKERKRERSERREKKQAHAAKKKRIASLFRWHHDSAIWLSSIADSSRLNDHASQIASFAGRKRGNRKRGKEHQRRERFTAACPLGRNRNFFDVGGATPHRKNKAGPALIYFPLLL